MQRAWTFVSSFVMLTAVGIVACSSADTPEGDDDGTTGGTSATGGSGGLRSPPGTRPRLAGDPPAAPRQLRMPGASRPVEATYSS